MSLASGLVMVLKLQDASLPLSLVQVGLQIGNKRSQGNKDKKLYFQPLHYSTWILDTISGQVLEVLFG